jgi:hypothetical protein
VPSPPCKGWAVKKSIAGAAGIASRRQFIPIRNEILSAEFRSIFELVCFLFAKLRRTGRAPRTQGLELAAFIDPLKVPIHSHQTNQKAILFGNLGERG